MARDGHPGLPFDPKTAAVDDPDRLDYELGRIKGAKIDPELFDYLYEYYYVRIFRFFFNRLKNRVDAQDLTADVFHLALSRLWQFRWLNKPLQAWLYRIAVNRLNRHLKLAQRQRSWLSPIDSMGEEVFVDSEQNPALKLEKIRQRRQIERHLAGLSNEERNWIALRYYEDLPVKEIAEIYGVPEGTMKARLHRALGKLRRAMKKDPNGNGDGDDRHG